MAKFIPAQSRRHLKIKPPPLTSAAKANSFCRSGLNFLERRKPACGFPPRGAKPSSRNKGVFFIEITKDSLRELLQYKLEVGFDTDLSTASPEEIYRVLATTVGEFLQRARLRYSKKVRAAGAKRVYYICMEFLMGRSFRNHLFNLGLYDMVKELLAEYEVPIEQILEIEPDAGLGNGGLGRLGACFLDALASGGYPAWGYSILYEYGIFRQKIVDGWQQEEPDHWLDDGGVWLTAVPSDAVEVRFGGRVEENWDGNFAGVKHLDYTVVRAIPHDMIVSGHGGESTSVLRLFSADHPGLDMNRFQSGDYAGAVEDSAIAEAISKVLYPNDNHEEGKKLRLRQQYFLVAATVQDIVKRHLSTYGDLASFSDKVAIHINDTHPALGIAEMMRVLLDDCGLSWDKAWEVTTRTFAYTNHTVMREALEQWDEELLRELLPRIHVIIGEINRRLVGRLRRKGTDDGTVSRMAILSGGRVQMANLAIEGSHSVNGVSRLHSEIIRQSVFADFYRDAPGKFRNVTNGIAYRRWLCEGNPALYRFVNERCGGDVAGDAMLLERLKPLVTDPAAGAEMLRIKKLSKERFAKAMAPQGVLLNPDSIFDVQVKRLHEYKRQHLNALQILARYLDIKNDPSADVTPHTYLFGAKAAPGYHMAKRIIRLICSIGEMLERDPAVRDILKVVFIEDYSVSKSELLLPAADFSEQISLAGTEASGTGNMKLMLGGAVTIGTLDGANVEIAEAVGEDHILLFGMTADEVERRRPGYRPIEHYNRDREIRQVLDMLQAGIAGVPFGDIADNLRNHDPYMVLADLQSYRAAQRRAEALYGDRARLAQSMLQNVASAGIFAADRSIAEYAANIWDLKRIQSRSEHILGLS